MFLQYKTIWEILSLNRKFNFLAEWRGETLKEVEKNMFVYV